MFPKCELSAICKSVGDKNPAISSKSGLMTVVW